ncbi:shikimate dehydrogenase [Turicibacter sp. TJ11]|uniref:shikimate dehydrogenase n=1 Tax=Turicibacter sp. TJ11 TaxID=2806443 RepID=UPI001F007666|nr:shikimate dehydrogenase [Turicibacter sp. TJ11]
MEPRITGHTELIGLIATPIRHSSSPKMHNAAFAKLGLDYAYLAFEVGNEQLEDTIKGFRAMNVRGCNVSMPNKTVVHKYLDKLSPAAELCGAVNTIVNDNGVLTGHITDGVGFMTSVADAGFDPIGKKVTIVGCGGAGTAIQIQAALDGVAELAIFNIQDACFERAKQTVKDINEKTNCKATLYDLADTEELRKQMADSYMFINATGVGMKPLEGQTYIKDASMLRPELIVCDVVYSPAKTALLELAESVGCPTLNGLGMMLFQGAAAFKLWTGQEMPIDHIKEVLNLK